MEDAGRNEWIRFEWKIIPFDSAGTTATHSTVLYGRSGQALLFDVTDDVSNILAGSLALHQTAHSQKNLLHF